MAEQLFQNDPELGYSFTALDAESVAMFALTRAFKALSQNIPVSEAV